jgi:hypothetical protein
VADPSASRVYVDAVHEAVNIVMRTNKGSGFTVDDPVRIGPIHKLLAPGVEMMFVSSVFGKKDSQWFDHGRKYHHNDRVCEQLVRLPVGLQPKLSNARAGGIYSVFFDISELTDSAPISDKIKQMASDAASSLPVRDATFVSRFPLMEVKARDAAEAARLIAAHLMKAKAEGWQLGQAFALVDGWRNDYELTKGAEKTFMRFDMRPMMFANTLELTALTLLAGNPKLEEMIGNLAASKTLQNNSSAHDRPSIKAYWIVGTMIALAIISAVALGRLTHSFLVGIVAFFVLFAVLKRLALKVFYRDLG